MHTYARLRGHGLAVVPFAPYAIRRIGDGADDRIAVDHGGRRAFLDPREPLTGEPLQGVADLTPVDSAPGWRIEFAGHSVAWPNRYALWQGHGAFTFEAWVRWETLATLRDVDPPYEAGPLFTIGTSTGGSMTLTGTQLSIDMPSGSTVVPGDASDHQSDWEGATVAVPLADPNTFDYIAIDAHDSGPWRYLRDVLYCDGGGSGSCGTEEARTGDRVDVYVAHGSHATCPHACEFDCF